jgi:peptidoglycan hydrolase CwlO-like protein
MKKHLILFIILSLLLVSCGASTSKKRSLDQTLYKYATVIRWSNFDGAIGFLKPGMEDVLPSDFELNHLKQFKVSRYSESPIRPGSEENIILQDVEIELYNIHNNKTKTIYDQQTWEYDEDYKRWLLTSGLPKI